MFWGQSQKHNNIGCVCGKSKGFRSIVFSGKKIRGAWKGSKPSPNTYYGISENGWRDASVFAN